MKLYQHKELDVCFVMLCLDGNPTRFKNTAASIRHNYRHPYVATVTPSMPKSDLDDVKKEFTVAVSKKDTVTSLINAGIEACTRDWALLVVAGTWVRPLLVRKYGFFVDRDDDVLFPVVDRQFSFVDGTINGILIRKDVFKKIGPMPELGPIEVCKLFWAMDACESGSRFKAVVGAQIT
jgi:hypothetical protein